MKYTHANHLYKFQQAHTSQVGWEPPNVPALWIDEGAYSGGSSTATTVPPTATKPSATNTPIGATATKPPATNTTVPPTATKPPATNTPAATATGSSSFPAWNCNNAYSAGNEVTYNGRIYKALVVVPAGECGWIPGSTPTVWQDMGPAGPTSTPTFVPATNTPGGPTATKTNTPTSFSSGLPKHVITGYWQDFDNGATDLRLSGVPTTYGLIAVAFANATTTAGAVDFSIDSTLASKLGGYTQSNFVSDVNTLHGQGCKVIISVGGQNGSISVSDSTSATNFANSVETLMTNWGFDGVDIDLENGINPTYMAQALQQIASSKSGVIISLAPQTIDMQSTSAG